jgi:hypothetical protein
VRPHVLEAPFSDRTQSLTVLGTALKVLPLEPVVWISITRPEVMALPEDAPRFPAVVDTGHASSLSIKQEHLGKLVDPAALPILGTPAALVYADGRRASLPRYQARVWLHGFHPDPARQPGALRLPTRDGIVCYRTAPPPRERGGPDGAGFGGSSAVPRRLRRPRRPSRRAPTFRSSAPGPSGPWGSWSRSITAS